MRAFWANVMGRSVDGVSGRWGGLEDRSENRVEVELVAKGFEFGEGIVEIDDENGFAVVEAVEDDFVPKMLSPKSGGGLEGVGT